MASKVFFPWQCHHSHTCFLNGVVHKTTFGEKRDGITVKQEKERKLINGLENKYGFLTPLWPLAWLSLSLKSWIGDTLLWNVYTLYSLVILPNCVKYTSHHKTDFVPK